MSTPWITFKLLQILWWIFEILEPALFYYLCACFRFKFVALNNAWTKLSVLTGIASWPRVGVGRWRPSSLAPMWFLNTKEQSTMSSRRLKTSVMAITRDPTDTPSTVRQIYYPPITSSTHGHIKLLLILFASRMFNHAFFVEIIIPTSPLTPAFSHGKA